jgi:Arc/MetJ family transcription regulator
VDTTVDTNTAVDTAVTPEPEDRKELLEKQFTEIEQAQEAKPDRPRDSAGKFATADNAVPPKPKDAAPATTAPATEEVPVWKRPPASWKKDYHEVWNTADPRMQEYAWQREEQMKAGVQPLLAKAEFADSVQKVMAPYMDTVRGLGVSPAQAVEALMQADHILRHGSPEQKLGYFAQLAQHYGIDLGGVPQHQTAPVDSNYTNLANEINQVRGEIASWKERQEAELDKSLMTDVVRFSQTHEHFEAVRPVMATLLQSGMAETLEDAYTKAIRLDDSLAQQATVSPQAGRAVNQAAARDRAAKLARSAAVSVKGSTPGTTAATKAQDRRSMLEEQFANLNERL